MDAQISGPRAAGAHGVEQRQLSVGAIHGKCADGSGVIFPLLFRLIGRIQAGSCGVEHQAIRACGLFKYSAWRQRPRGAIHLKEMNAASVAGRQIHLTRADNGERGAKRADVSHERPLRSGRLGPKDSGKDAPAAGQSRRGFQE